MPIRWRGAPTAAVADPEDERRAQDKARLDRLYADATSERSGLEGFAEGFLDPTAPSRRKQLKASIDNERAFDRYGYGEFDDPEKKRRSREVLDALHEDESAAPEDTRGAYRKYGPLAMRAAGGVVPGLIGLASKIPGAGRFIGKSGIPLMLASGALGESAATISELMTGDRKAAEETPRKTLARIGVAAGMNTITGGLFSKMALPARLAGHAISGAAQSAGSVAAEDLLGEGRLPDSHELGESARGGAIFGTILGGGGEAAVGAGNMLSRLRDRIRARDIRGSRPAAVERAPWEKGKGVDDVEFTPDNAEDMNRPFEADAQAEASLSRRGRSGIDSRFELEGARQPAMQFDEPVSPTEFGEPRPDFEQAKKVDAIQKRLAQMEEATRLREHAETTGAEDTVQRGGAPFDERFALDTAKPGELPLGPKTNVDQLEVPGAEPPVKTAIERATSPLMQRIIDLEHARRTAAAAEAGAEPVTQRGGEPFDPRYAEEGARPGELPLGPKQDVNAIEAPGAEPLVSDVRREMNEKTGALRSLLEKVMRRPPDAAAAPGPVGEPRQSPLPGMLDADRPGIRVNRDVLNPPPDLAAAAEPAAGGPKPAPAPPAAAKPPARPFLDVGDQVVVGKHRGKVVAAPTRTGEPMVVELTLEDGTVVHQEVNPSKAMRIQKPPTQVVDSPEALVAQQEQADAAARVGQIGQELEGHAKASRQGQAPQKRPAAVITAGQGTVESTQRPVTDITRSELSKKLRIQKQAAVTDPVTKGLNRQGFDQIRERRAQQSGPGTRTVFRGDLDNFKAINDELGHEAGDKALRVVHDTIKKHLRQGDLVSRVGGDEFAIDMELASPERAKAIVEELETAVTQALKDAGFGTAKGREVGLSLGHGPTEALADQAAMVRKAERGVSKPRDAAPLEEPKLAAAQEWKPKVEEPPAAADDVVDLGDIGQDASPEAINANLADADIIAPRGPNYTAEVLRQAEAGTPGFAEETGPNGSTRFVYRGPDGTPAGVATVNGKTIIDFAVDKTRGGLAGRAALALGDAMEARGVDAVEGGMTPDAKNFLDRIRGRAAKKAAAAKGSGDAGDTPDTARTEQLPAAVIEAGPKALKDISDADLEALSNQLDEVADYRLRRTMPEEWREQLRDAEDVLKVEHHRRMAERDAREHTEGLKSGKVVVMGGAEKGSSVGWKRGSMGFEADRKTGLRKAKDTLTIPGHEGEYVHSGSMSHGSYEETDAWRVVPEAEWTGPKRTDAEQHKAWDANEGGDFFERRKRGTKPPEPDKTQPERGDYTGMMLDIKGKRHVIAGPGPKLVNQAEKPQSSWHDEESYSPEHEARRAQPAPTVPALPEGRYGAKNTRWSNVPYEGALESARESRSHDIDNIENLEKMLAKPKGSAEDRAYWSEDLDRLREELDEDADEFRQAFGDDAHAALIAEAKAAEPEPATVLGKKLKVGKAKTLVQQAKANGGIGPKPKIDLAKAAQEIQDDLDAKNAERKTVLGKKLAPTVKVPELLNLAEKGSKNRFAGKNFRESISDIVKESKANHDALRTLEDEMTAASPDGKPMSRERLKAIAAEGQKHITADLDLEHAVRDAWGDEGVRVMKTARGPALSKEQWEARKRELGATVEKPGKTLANPESRYAGDNLEDMLPQLAKEQRNRLSLVKQLEKTLDNPKLTAKKRQQAQGELSMIREQIEGTRQEMRDGWGHEGVKALDNAVVDHVPESKGTYLPQRDPKAALREKAQQIVGDFSSGRNKDLSTHNEPEIREALKHVLASPAGKYPEFELAAAKRLGMVDTAYPVHPDTPKAVENVVTAETPDPKDVDHLDTQSTKGVKATDRKIAQVEKAKPEITAPEPTKMPVNVEPEKVEGEGERIFKFVLRGSGRVRTYRAKTLGAAKAKFDKKFKRSDIESVSEITAEERPDVTATAKMFRSKSKTITTTVQKPSAGEPVVEAEAPAGEGPAQAPETKEVPRPGAGTVEKFKAMMRAGVKALRSESGGEGWYSQENVEQFRGLREELKADIEREVRNAERFMDAGDFDTAQRILAAAHERRMRYFLGEEGFADPRTLWLMGRVAAGALYGGTQEPEDPLSGALKYGAGAAVLGSSQARTLAARFLKGGKATFGEAARDLMKPSRTELKVRSTKNPKVDLTAPEHMTTPEEALPEWFAKIVPSMEKFDDALRAKAGQKLLPKDRRDLRNRFFARHANELKVAAAAANKAGMPNRATYMRMLAKQLLDEPTVLERFLSGATGHRMSGQRIASEITQHIYRLGTGANWSAGFINRVAQPYLALAAMPLRYLRKGKAYVRTPQGKALVDHLKIERPTDAPEGSYSRKMEKLDDVLQWPLRYGDIRNREDVFAGAYLFASESGRSHDASLRYAAETMRATQAMPGELGNPPMLRELGPLRPFMKYPIVWAELVKNVLEKPWDDAGKRRFLGAMIGAGVLGEMAGLDMKSILIPRFAVSAQAVTGVEDAYEHMTRQADHPLSDDLEALLVPVQLRKTKEFFQQLGNSKDGVLTKSDERGVVSKRTMGEGVLNTLLGVRTRRQRLESEARGRFFDKATAESRTSMFESRGKRRRAAAAYDAGDMATVRKELQGLPPATVSQFYRTRDRDAVERRRLQLSPRLRQRLADLAAEVRAEGAQP